LSVQFKKPNIFLLKINPHSFPTNPACTLQPPPPLAGEQGCVPLLQNLCPSSSGETGRHRPPSALARESSRSMPAWLGGAGQLASPFGPLRSAPLPVQTSGRPAFPSPAGSWLSSPSPATVVIYESGRRSRLRVRPLSSSPSPATGEEVEHASLVSVRPGPVLELESRREGSRRSSTAPAPLEFCCTRAAGH
jgi:hypothetical protein